MKLDHASCPSSRNFLLHGRHDVQVRLTSSFHVQVHALTKNEMISNVRAMFMWDCPTLQGMTNDVGFYLGCCPIIITPIWLSCWGRQMLWNDFRSGWRRDGAIPRINPCCHARVIRAARPVRPPPAQKNACRPIWHTVIGLSFEDCS